MTRHNALNELVTYFQSQLEENEQALKYFTETRGWTLETIKNNRLGYAPPGDTKAAEYLGKQGYDKQEILSTGAFTDDLTCLWQGRYVFPYLDDDNNAVYAIARCTGDKGGGAAGYDGHEDDFLAGKYAKLSHSKDYCTIDAEPVWGLDAVTDDDTEVYVAEGIADAISLSAKGYTVISPVAKQFKKDDFEKVAETLVNHDIETVYIIPDMDDPDDYDTHPPGISGALRTSKYLNEQTDVESLDLQIVELPIPDGKTETDLDEVIQTTGIDAVEEAVGNSIKPTAHALYDKLETTSKNESPEYKYDYDGVDASGLMDITMDDVLPSNFSGRGHNPIKPKGSSDGYFVVDDGLAYDHKRGGESQTATYNPITYLLCKIGLRDVGNPEGSLSNEEVAKVWTHAKSEGIISQDAKIPKRALVYVANTNLGYDFDRDDYLPTAIYQEVVNHIEDDIGLDTGRLDALNTSPYYTEIDAVELAERLNIDYEDSIGKHALRVNGEIVNPPELAAVGLGYIPNPTEELRDEDYARACAWLNNEYLDGADAPYKALQGIGKKLNVDWSNEEKEILSTKDRDRCERIFQNMDPELP